MFRLLFVQPPDGKSEPARLGYKLGLGRVRLSVRGFLLVRSLQDVLARVRQSGNLLLSLSAKDRLIAIGGERGKLQKIIKGINWLRSYENYDN